MKILRTFDEKDFLSKFPQYKDSKVYIDLSIETSIYHWTSCTVSIEVFQDVKRKSEKTYRKDINSAYESLYTKEGAENTKLGHISELKEIINNFKSGKPTFIDRDDIIFKFNLYFEETRFLWEEFANIFSTRMIITPHNLPENVDSYPYEFLEYFVKDDFKESTTLSKYLENRKMSGKDYKFGKKNLVNGEGYQYSVCFTKKMIIENYDDIDFRVAITKIRLFQEDFLELYDFLPFEIWMNLVELYNQFDEKYIFKIKDILDKHNENFTLCILNAVTKDNFHDLVKKFKKDKYELLSDLTTDLFMDILSLNKQFFEYEKLVNLPKYDNINKSTKIEIAKLYEDESGIGFRPIDAKRVLKEFISSGIYFDGRDEYTISKDDIIDDSIDKMLIKDIEKHLKYEGYTHY